jgi:hypothetical protein
VISEATTEQIDASIKQQKALEHRVDQAFAALDGTRSMLPAAPDGDKENKQLKSLACR